MTTMYDDSNIRSIHDLRTFLDAAEVFKLQSSCPRKERAQWIYDRFVRFKYQTLPKKDKGIVLRYLKQITGLTEKQIDRYVAAYKQRTKLCIPYERTAFSKIYRREDQELLAEIDNAHGRRSGFAAQNLCRQQYDAGDERFERLAAISKTHLYRLRGEVRYRECAMTYEKTQSVQSCIGERRKHEPHGQPGFLRVDTVHQGDKDGEKGVYHINMIDVITQWEVVLSVQQISEKYLKPVLEEGLSLFPFVIQGFHSDNGSEYINDCVSRILKGMGIEQTKGRPRKCNDNALVESKNAAIIRKWLGRHHIPRKFAARLNVFHREHLVPYINLIRPCAFPTVEILPDGKRKVHYKHENYKTPCEKLCSLKDVERYLKPGITVEMLQEQAKAQSPNERAMAMQAARKELLTLIFKTTDML